MKRFARELSRLRAEHQHLDRLSDALLTLINSGDAACLQDVQPYWQEFHTVLTRHLKCEDWILYPRLSSSADQYLSVLAGNMSHELGGLSAQLAEFDAVWDQEARRQEPQAYLQAMRAILQAVDHRAAREEQHLFPAAAKAEIAVQRGGFTAHGVDLMPSLA